MTGDSDYLLRVVVADVSAYEVFLKDHLTQIPRVSCDQIEFRAEQGEIRNGVAAVIRFQEESAALSWAETLSRYWPAKDFNASMRAPPSNRLPSGRLKLTWNRTWGLP